MGLDITLQRFSDVQYSLKCVFHALLLLFIVDQRVLKLVFDVLLKRFILFQCVLKLVLGTRLERFCDSQRSLG